MLKVKYLKYGTCKIVSNDIRRDPLTELYILNKKISEFTQNNIFKNPSKTLYIVYVTDQISNVWDLLDSYKWGYS